MVGGVDYREKLLYPEMGKGGGCRMKETSAGFLSGRQKKLVCVTTGNSCLGVHIVKQLLARAYLVRITVQNQGIFYIYVHTHKYIWVSSSYLPLLLLLLLLVLYYQT